MKITLRTAGAGRLPDETDISDAFDIIFGEGEARIHASVVNDQLTLRCSGRIVLEPMAANSVAVAPVLFSAPRRS